MINHRTTLSVALGCLCILVAQQAQAHFIWLLPETTDSGTQVQVYFSEDASPDDPALLSYVEAVRLQRVCAGEDPVPLAVQKSDDAVFAPVGADDLGNCVFIATHDLGVMTRGDAVFRLNYYAKTASSRDAWTEIDCTEHLMLDVVPTIVDGQVRVQVRFEGEPADGAQVAASGPGMDDFEGTTNADGLVLFTPASPGIYSIRARHVQQQSGEVDGQTYHEVRHYCTATLDTKGGEAPVAERTLPPLQQPVTSFGGAVIDGKVYIYGGHTGGAHSYSMEEQDHHVRRLDVEAGEWEVLGEGPPLQGLALVAHADRLYRIGGFTAKNAEGEEHDLWSQDSVAAFDLNTNEWTDLPPLPEARSSFDAAVLDDTIYVIGGWALAGDAESNWHHTAWAMDLSADSSTWESLPTPPFQRRALAVAAHEGKIYAIGGMQSEGGPTRRVDIFNPASGEWTLGPELVGDEGMTGFGASAFATGGRLYVTTYSGTLQRLSEDGSAWEVVSETPTARFFHRMLPIDEEHMLMVGGANMGQGKFTEVEVINLEFDE